MTTSETLSAMQTNLTKAFVEREDAQAAIKIADQTILAIRNVLAGVQMGQKLSAEAAEAAVATPAIT